MYQVSSFFFFMGLFIFCFKFRHFLILLMSLEIMVLSLFFMMFIFTSMIFGEGFLSIFYLTMSVCESALGLSILVLMIRSYSSDMLIMLSNLW
uniref:NADH-ubiquinone oxidoreductase chain 4L n=1 Tax=Curculionidae sp. BMNH 1040049 TaxID=1903777 RepID=A0A343A5X2_9CUCU|nr:NADH dehydrogenase subunit 4L [Curculionidae sp. BMNH 1040049]